MKSIIALAVMLLASTGAAQPRAQPRQETLTLARAIEIALQQQPSVRQTAAPIESSLARVDQAKVAQRPTITLSGSAGVGSENVNRHGGRRVETGGRGRGEALTHLHTLHASRLAAVH